jgi:hypothetical protein
VPDCGKNGDDGQDPVPEPPVVVLDVEAPP